MRYEDSVEQTTTMLGRGSEAGMKLRDIEWKVIDDDMVGNLLVNSPGSTPFPLS